MFGSNIKRPRNTEQDDNELFAATEIEKEKSLIKSDHQGPGNGGLAST